MLLIRASVGLAAALLLATCSIGRPVICPDGCAPPFDAGPDGGPADTRGPSDAPMDSGRDGSTRDSALDGGPTDPGWALLPGLPTGCVVERAEHPERLPVPSWESCGEGCQRAALDFALGPASRDGFYRDGRGWVYLGGPDGPPGTTRGWTAIAPVDGAGIAGWRYDLGAPVPYCSVRFPSIDDGRWAVVLHFVGDRELDLVEERIYSGSLDVSGTPETPVLLVEAPFVGRSRTVQHLAPTPELLAVEIIGGEIAVSHGGTFADVFTASPTSGAYDASAEGDHVVFADVISDWRLMHWTPETGTEPYYDPVDLVANPLLDSGVLVWARGADFDPTTGLATRAELWSAPFVREATALSPTFVAPSVDPTDARFYDGVYGWVTANGPGFEARLVDVPSGRVRTLRHPRADVACTAVIYVSRTEVLVECADPGVRGTVLYRLDPDVHARA